MLITVGAIIGMAQVEEYVNTLKLQFDVQGVGKLSSPFLDTLSKYDPSRSTAIETTWDQIQTDVS